MTHFGDVNLNRHIIKIYFIHLGDLSWDGRSRSDGYDKEVLDHLSDLYLHFGSRPGSPDQH
jgi:hypothetical protein